MNKIIHDDCLNYLRSLPDKAYPLILTDPPYGLGIAKRGVIGTGVNGGAKTSHVAAQKSAILGLGSGAGNG